jgi:ABC-type sugar transport system ATPase subunit
VILKLKDVVVRAAERGRRPRVDRLSLSVHAGEIVGLAGLHGSGNSDLLMGLFGAYGRRTKGTILLDGRPYRPTTPRRAIDRGLALVTNDRQGTGLVLSMGVAANATLASLPRVSPWGLMLAPRELRLADETTRSLRLRAASLRQSVSTLSGGNQQKVVLAKWINTQPRVILLDEPTRGVDIGAKQEIYQLMHAWRDAGHALILITSEMPELLMMSDRILVMHRGRAIALLSRDQATQERILHAAMGGADHAA